MSTVWWNGRLTSTFVMIFRDGVYHADPHPGNFLLPDGEHFAILDFGDIGRVSRTRQTQLESLVIAVGTHDLDGMTDVVIEMTSPPPGTDVAALRDDIESWLNRYLLVGVGHLDVTIINSGMQLMHTHHLVLPGVLALLFRVLLRLQGLGRAVGTDVRVTELLEPYVKKMMAERFNPSRIARTAVHTLRDWERLVATLPQDVNAVLDRIRTGPLGVDFQVHDADGAVDHLVDGLMAAWSVLASVQLIGAVVPARRSPASRCPDSSWSASASRPGRGWVAKRRPREVDAHPRGELRQVIAGLDALPRLGLCAGPRSSIRASRRAPAIEPRPRRRCAPWFVVAVGEMYMP